MLQEKSDLIAKIKRATKAVENVPYGMNKTQIMLLAKQIKAMGEYLNCLNERLEYEKIKEKDDESESQFGSL